MIALVSQPVCRERSSIMSAEADQEHCLQAMEEGSLIARSAIGPRGNAAGGSASAARPAAAEPAEVEMSEPPAVRTAA